LRVAAAKAKKDQELQGNAVNTTYFYGDNKFDDTQSGVIKDNI